MKWYESKTNRTAIGGVLTALGALAAGAIDPATAIQSIVACLLAVFMRQGVEKSGK